MFLWIGVEVLDDIVALSFEEVMVTVLGQEVFELLPTNEAHVLPIDSTKCSVRLVAGIGTQLLSLFLN